MKYVSWALILFVCFVFIQSLFFKFTGSIQPQIIFGTIADWMAGNFLAPVSEVFRHYGAWAVGLTELFASILLLVPLTRFWGALIGIGTMSGAIFFHLGTPLGVDRAIDYQGNTDGGALFYMAVGVWISCAILLYLNRPKSA